MLIERNISSIHIATRTPVVSIIINLDLGSTWGNVNGVIGFGADDTFRKSVSRKGVTMGMWHMRMSEGLKDRERVCAEKQRKSDIGLDYWFWSTNE